MRKKDLMQLGITGVLVLVLILALSNAAKKSRLRSQKNALPRAVDLTVASPNQTNRPESKSLYKLLEQQAEAIELKRDPFTAAPIVNEKSLPSGVDLTGILWDQDNPLAIIDGEVVKKGAHVGIKTIVDIKRDRIILSDGQIVSEVRLEQ